MFFFSSRRRHTRCSRDWSSDVCSSDLVRTGRRLWIFHTIPKKGEFGYDTWEKGSAEYTGNTGVWTQITVDEQLGLVYLPVESPTSDFYGGDRPGDKFFGGKTVCVGVENRERQRHCQ